MLPNFFRKKKSISDEEAKPETPQNTCMLENKNCFLPEEHKEYYDEKQLLVLVFEQGHHHIISMRENTMMYGTMGWNSVPLGVYILKKISSLDDFLVTNV